jgi:mRNA interferase MazF
MQKDFTTWHTKKEMLDGQASRPYFYERQIWWVAIGLNIGDEEDGKGNDFARPVLILRKFNQNLFYGLSLSTTSKRGRYYFPLKCQDGSISVALLSHLRDYDTKRLLKKQTKVSKSQFLLLQTRLTELIMSPSR